MNIQLPQNLFPQFQSVNFPDEELPDYDPDRNYVYDDKILIKGQEAIYQAIQNDFSNKPPAAFQSNEYWLYVGRANSLRMIDGIVSSISQADEQEASISFVPTGVVNTVCLFNVKAINVKLEISVKNPSGEWEIQYTETYSLANPGSPVDYYEWFFTAPERRSDLILPNLPPYSSDSKFTLYFEESEGLFPAIGLVTAGFLKQFGWSQYGSSVGIQDYSRKDVDEFGNATIVRRKSVKRASFDVVLNTSKVSDTLRFLDANRATPLVFIGTEEYESTIIYGFYRDLDIVLSGPTISNASLEITGL